MGESVGCVMGIMPVRGMSAAVAVCKKSLVRTKPLFGVVSNNVGESSEMTTKK